MSGKHFEEFEVKTEIEYCLGLCFFLFWINLSRAYNTNHHSPEKKNFTKYGEGEFEITLVNL